MRILHTSDWHLGRSFHGAGMLEAQRSFVDQLVETVVTEEVDVLLISGDVYDRALPPVDVVNLFDDALVRVTATGCKVVITSGNHDSAIRLGFASRLLERGGVFLRTRVSELAQPCVVEGDGFELAVYGIPFLEPRMVAAALDVEQPGHFSVTQAAVERIHADLQARRHAGTVVSVVMAHTFASGGITSESERDLNIGGLGAVPLDLFQGFDYTALGHLHGRQTLSETVRYSGSPLPYSFSEARHQKGAWLVEIDAAGVTSVREVPFTSLRQLAVLRGTLAGLLEDPQLEWAQEAYCQVTLTDTQKPAQAMDSIRSRFPHTLVLSFDPEGAQLSQKKTYSQRVREAVDELDVCCGFLDHVRDRPASEPERQSLVEALESVRALEGSK
ncbi:exonuclease SbcCD subunit D [Pseudarthrobacter sp. J1738]|uniref:exonuclease SbcCD subunit D n=1 Tax=Pseudarthrobacter sp. J1738 TaxID=3420446 RepID=UPI003D2D1298